ncbi:FG-GAP repeat protein, partial [Streptomyces virginiae]
GFKSIAAGDFNGDGKQDIAGIDANNNLKLYT